MISDNSNILYLKREDVKLPVEFGSNIPGVNVAVGNDDNFFKYFKDIPPPDILIIEYWI